jgi:uncharacterized protein (TIGR03066 family)
MRPILAGLAVLVVVSQTRAEYRTVLVQVKQDKEKKASVAIHSDEKKEQQSAVSVEEAVKVIGAMKGWGSQVGVYVTSDRAISGAELKKLLAAVNDNPWLELEYFGREVPKVVADHFLKVAQGPMPPAQKPGEPKEALVGRWVSDDADSIPVEFGADGSMTLGLHQLDWKWQTAKGTYVVSDGGKVEYTAKLGGLTIRGHFTMKDGALIGPTGSNAAARWKKVPQGQPAGGAPPAAPERDPKVVFLKVCELVAALEGKHDLLKGVSKVKPAVQQDEQKRLKSAYLTFENNAVPPGKNDAKAKDESKPFFSLSVQLWSGRSQSPPANLHEFAWQNQTYQMWVRVSGSDAELVRLVRKAVDEPLQEPLPAEAPSPEKVEPDPVAPTHKAADVVLIANWLCGHDPAKAFAKPFGDSKYLTDGKDSLLYTDVPGVKTPAGLKAVNYEFVKARMQRIKSGHKVAPAMLIVRSSLDEPAEDEIRRDKREPDGRVYYVEVAIGNLGWHWLKMVVREDGDKPNVKILWEKVS